MFDSLRLSRKLRRERKRNAEATKRVQERQKLVHSVMLDISAAGYTIIKTPSL